jgi:hypothetical protein
LEAKSGSQDSFGGDMTDEELIRRVATEVMGWRLKQINIPESVVTDEWFYQDANRNFLSFAKDWLPLTNLNQAFLGVVEKMIGDGWFVDISWLGGPPDGWRCRFYRLTLENNNFYAYHNNLGYAICMAALAAKEAK